MVQAPGRMELPFTMMRDGGWVGHWGTSWPVVWGSLDLTREMTDKSSVQDRSQKEDMSLEFFSI